MIHHQSHVTESYRHAAEVLQSISVAFEHSVSRSWKFMVCACRRCTLKLTAHTNHKFPVNGNGMFERKGNRLYCADYRKYALSCETV